MATPIHIQPMPEFNPDAEIGASLATRWRTWSQTSKCIFSLRALQMLHASEPFCYTKLIPWVFVILKLGKTSYKHRYCAIAINSHSQCGAYSIARRLSQFFWPQIEGGCNYRIYGNASILCAFYFFA